MNYLFLSQEPCPKHRQRWCRQGRHRRGGHVPVLHPGLVWVQRAGGTGERWWPGVVQPEWTCGGTHEVGGSTAHTEADMWVDRGGNCPSCTHKMEAQGVGAHTPSVVQKGGCTWILQIMHASLLLPHHPVHVPSV